MLITFWITSLCLDRWHLMLFKQATLAFLNIRLLNDVGQYVFRSKHKLKQQSLQVSLR